MALPLFTTAGLVFARTGAAQRSGAVFIAAIVVRVPLLRPLATGLPALLAR